MQNQIGLFCTPHIYPSANCPKPKFHLCCHSIQRRNNQRPEFTLHATPPDRDIEYPYFSLDTSSVRNPAPFFQCKTTPARECVFSSVKRTAVIFHSHYQHPAKRLIYQGITTCPGFRMSPHTNPESSPNRTEERAPNPRPECSHFQGRFFTGIRIPKSLRNPPRSIPKCRNLSPRFFTLWLTYGARVKEPSGAKFSRRTARRRTRTDRRPDPCQSEASRTA